MSNPLLIESAPLALDKSNTLCDMSECSWYHGPWQYLRLLGVMVSSQEHEQFYLEELQKLSESGQYNNILISGTTDYAMTEIIHKAYTSFPNVTVVDRCEAPLFLNLWYAEKFSLPLAVKKSDILDFLPDCKYDVICTHCFLGYFPEEILPLLIRRWRGLLRKGGKVLTINRIRPGMSGLLKFTPEQSKQFIEKVLESGWEDLGLTKPQVYEWAQRFTENFTVYPVKSLDFLLSLFESNGFRVVKSLNEGQFVSSTAPSTTGEANRCYLVLQAE